MTTTERILQLAAKHGLLITEDCLQAMDEPTRQLLLGDILEVYEGRRDDDD